MVIIIYALIAIDYGENGVELYELPLYFFQIYGHAYA